MGTNTRIEWTDATWNPVTGCSNVQVHPERLKEPLRWRKPRTVLVCDKSDLFHHVVPREFIAAVFATMALASAYTFLVLTKQPGRMAELLPRLPELDQSLRVWVSGGGAWPLPNVWLGVSVEDQPQAEERIPVLLETPAAVRFVSCEPLLGAVDLSGWFDMHGPWNYTEYGVLCSCGAPMDADEVCTGDKIDWVIVGGESGPGARPMHPDWVRSIRDQCQEAGVPFFFKQWGGVNKKAAGRVLDGRTWDEMPRV